MPPHAEIRAQDKDKAGSVGKKHSISMSALIANSTTVAQEDIKVEPCHEPKKLAATVGTWDCHHFRGYDMQADVHSGDHVVTAYSGLQVSSAFGQKGGRCVDDMEVGVVNDVGSIYPVLFELNGGPQRFIKPKEMLNNAGNIKTNPTQLKWRLWDDPSTVWAWNHKCRLSVSGAICHFVSAFARHLSPCTIAMCQLESTFVREGIGLCRVIVVCRFSHFAAI